MSSRVTARLPETTVQLQQSSTVRHYRGVRGNDISLRETRHDGTGRNGAIEYVLKDESRRGFTAADLGLLSLGLVLWTTVRSTISAALGLAGLAFAFGTVLLSDRTNTLLLVESVGVHIINQKTIIGALEEYLPWNTISDVFINEVISEQKVLYYLTFVIKEITNNGEERIRLIPLFRDLKPERKCLEYINSTDFSYCKELMKIIRRVIKWQPRQGQHFGTKNLLVTYNHASWTRQDKMFAIMKFCDRPDAIAFPHAFILTVKIFNQEQRQRTEQMMGTSLAPRSRPLSSFDDKSVDAISSVHQEADDSSDQDVSWSQRTRSKQRDLVGHTSANLTVRNATTSEKIPKIANGKSAGISKADSSSNSSNNSNGNSKSNNSDARDMNSEWQNETEELSGTTLDSNAVDENNDEDSNSSSETHSDSASMPYQYLIERDIERELENSRMAKISPNENSMSSVNDSEHALGNDGDNDSKSSRDSRKSIRFRSRQESRDNESMPPPDLANLRSSDITDLVMKGLMFTIRQDKDTVTVVEQKTKLELDEVLENSEKVETKEGDPCLLNSSLLRLEKMITRIQEPVVFSQQRSNGISENALVSFMDLASSINSENRGKRNEVETTETEETCQSTGALEMTNCWSHFFEDKDITDSNLANIQKAFDESSMYMNDDNQDEDLELRMEEEEDIIPEALVHDTFFGSNFEVMNKAPSTNNFQDLLMDDIEIGDEKVNEPHFTKITTSSTSNSSITTNGTSFAKNSQKLPKVISNEIITNDQIPPALLKALKSKSSIEQQPYRSETHISKKNDDILQSNSSINLESIDDKTKTGVKDTPENTIIDNKIDQIQDKSVKNCVQDELERYEECIENKVKNCTVFNSVSDVAINSKSLFISENTSDDSSLKSTNIRSSDISNSSSVDNIRLTRSNAKLYAKPNENLPTSNESSPKHERYMETRARKLLEKTFKKQLSQDTIRKTVVRQKRRKNMNEDSVLKYSKSINLDGSEGERVKVKIWKLISDLTYGVKVVVERLDFSNIPR